MAHIDFGEGIPGIRGPMIFSPDTAKPLNDLAQVLLTGSNTLTLAEREMIATYVSSQNDCLFCQNCHGSIAAQHLGGSDADYELISQIKQNYADTPVSDKMKALLGIAGKVQQGGKYVTTDDIARAREQGATDKEIHVTVHIAAAFCLYNRYLDGLATWERTEPVDNREIAKKSAKLGYVGRDYSKPLESLANLRDKAQR